MTFPEFKASLTSNTPPAGLGQELQALWYEGKDNWHEAHELAQVANSPGNCLIHAYLHRVEGDNWNANYWYQRAGRKMPMVPLKQEWEQLVQEFLQS